MNKKRKEAIGLFVVILTILWLVLSWVDVIIHQDCGAYAKWNAYVLFVELAKTLNVF